jgi:hypothetical protein
MWLNVREVRIRLTRCDRDENRSDPSRKTDSELFLHGGLQGAGVIRAANVASKASVRQIAPLREFAPSALVRRDRSTPLTGSTKFGTLVHANRTDFTLARS